MSLRTVGMGCCKCQIFQCHILNKNAAENCSISNLEQLFYSEKKTSTVFSLISAPSAFEIDDKKKWGVLIRGRALIREKTVCLSQI